MFVYSIRNWSVGMLHYHYLWNICFSFNIRSGTGRTAMTTWTAHSPLVCSAYVHPKLFQLWSTVRALPCLVLGVCASQGCTKYTDNDLMLWVPGGLEGLLEAVQKMVAGKADREEVQALKRVLGDKVNLADHQVHHHHCLRRFVGLSMCANPVSACCEPISALPACLPACMFVCLSVCLPA